MADPQKPLNPNTIPRLLQCTVVLFPPHGPDFSLFFQAVVKAKPATHPSGFLRPLPHCVFPPTLLFSGLQIQACLGLVPPTDPAPGRRHAPKAD